MIDRTILPPVSEISNLKLQPIQQFTLCNGITMNIVNRCDADVCKIVLLWNGGKYDVNSKYGLSLMTSLLLNGTTQHTSDQITELFDFYGSKVSCTCDNHFTKFSLKALNRTLPDLLPLVLEILQHATFPENELSAKARKLYASESMQRKTVQFQSANLCKTLFFPPQHPAITDDNIEDIKNITQDDIIAIYNDVIKGVKPEIYLAGNITQEVLSILKATFENLQTGKAGQKQRIVPILQDVKAQTKKLFMPNQVQSSLDIAIPLGNCSESDYYKLRPTTVALGGYFGSRLNKIIREKKGLTYGIRASIVNTLEGKVICINSQCAGKNADEVIEEIIRQINILKTESISNKELTSVRRYYLSALSNTSESIFSTLDYYISCYTVGVPLNSFAEREKTIHNLTAEDITTAAKTYFNTNKMLAAIAGDIKE